MRHVDCQVPAWRPPVCPWRWQLSRMCVSVGVFGQASEREDLVGYAFALVFLQEVGSAGDFDLISCVGNELAELLTVRGEREYRVGVGECHQSGLGPTAQGIGDG